MSTNGGVINENKIRAEEVSYLVTFDASRSEFFLVTASAVNLLFSRDKRLCADRCLAHAATKTFLVPLSSLVFHLLHS